MEITAGEPLEVCLEGAVQARVTLRAHSEQELRLAVVRAFGFRGPGACEFELLPEGSLLREESRHASRPARQIQVRAVCRPQLTEAASLQSLFSEVALFDHEVVYSELARVAGIPLLRLHRVVAPACGAAVAFWFEAFREELEGVTSLRDPELRSVAWHRAWRNLQARIQAVFPKLVEQLPEELTSPPLPTSEENSESCNRLFSRVLDEVRLRVLPLRSRRVIANGVCSTDPSHLWPGTKRLLRVCFDPEDGAKGRAKADQASGEFLVALDSGQGSSEPSAFSGHDLYFEVAKFFRQKHVQVKNRSGTPVTLDRPHQSLLGQLPCSSDGVCVDLVAYRFEPKPGSFDQLYREVLRILGPRHFMLDQSYRLQMLGSENSMLTTTQGSTIVATVIVIPVNYLEGKQMYVFRSPRYRQCKAALRTFDEFKEMLEALVQVYGLLQNQLCPITAERLRQTCTEGAPGQTPLARLQNRRSGRLSHAWKRAEGCAQASRSAIGLIGGMQTAASEVSGLHRQWWIPEDMSLLDRIAMFHVQDGLHEHYDNLWMLNILGGSYSADVVTPEMKRILDMYSIDSAADTPMMPYWLPGSPAPGTVGSGNDTGWADCWSIAVGGFMGLLFGLAEGVYSKVSERKRCGEPDPGPLILQKMLRRGSTGLGVSALCQMMGKVLRSNLPDGRYASISKKSIPTSQVVVFLGTCAWAMFSHHQYVEPSVVRRIWNKDLNLAEQQAVGIMMTSGLACSCSVGGFFAGSHLMSSSLGSLAGPAGAFAGSLMPFVLTLLITGWDWWNDRARRRQMKAAALQTLGLPEPSSLGIEVFRPMLAARYKLLACYLHPDKNDSGRCDTTTVFSQVRLAKEILEQELQDYQSCPRERLKHLFDQMLVHCGYRREKFVSQHPSGVIMNILEDGSLEDFDDAANHRAELESITTVESRSVTASPSPTGSPRSVQRFPDEGAMGHDPYEGNLRLPSSLPNSGSSGPPSPWVMVPGTSRGDE